MTTIYVDNAATTKTSRTAIEAMLPYFDKIYGNPSSLHSVGQAAADALRKAREEAAEVLGCEPNEINSPPAAARQIIRRSFPRRLSAQERARSI